VRPFTEKDAALLETFAAQAVIAIENARLFQELNDSNASLREALAQQTATADVLQALSRAPTDPQTVLDTIADSATRLCGAETTMIGLVEDDGLRPVGGVNLAGRRFRLADPSRSVPLARSTTPGARAIVDGVTVHIDDLAAEAVEELTATQQRREGARTALA